MKVPERYGGLGLSPVYYHRALGLLGSWHPASRRCSRRTSRSGWRSHCCSSAPRSSGAPGSARRPRSVSAFLLTEPDVGSDPARLRRPPCPPRMAGLPDRRRQAVGDQRHHRRRGGGAGQGAQGEGHRGGITAFIVPYHDPGVTVEHANRFMGLRGIENSQTRLTDASSPPTNVIGGEGRGPASPSSTLDAGRLSLPGSRWAPPSGPPRSPASSPASGCSGASRWASTTRWPRWSPSSPPAPSAGGDGRRERPARRRGAQRHPHRGGATDQALRVGAVLAGRRRAGSGLRRQGLRDRGLAAASEARTAHRRAGAPRLAGLPHLRGHVPGDAPGGGPRPWTSTCRSPASSSPPTRPTGEKARAAAPRRPLLRALAAPAGVRQGPQNPKTPKPQNP